MALLDFKTRPIHKESFEFDHYNNLFDQLIDSKFYDLSDDATTADRRSSNDWSSFIDLPDTRSGNGRLRSPKPGSQTFDFPERDRNQTGTTSRISERVVSLATLDSVQNPTHPHTSALLSRRKFNRPGAPISAIGLKPRSAGVYKTAQKISTSPRMSSRHSRQHSNEKPPQKRDQSTGSVEPQDQPPRQRTLTVAPPSVNMTQTAWTQHHYDPFGQESASATATHNQLAFRHNTIPSNQQTYGHGAYSPLSTPHGEHLSSDDMTAYYQSPGTPYFTEADVLTPHDFGSYSTLRSEQSFPFGQETHQTGLEMSYGHGQEFADSPVQPWWIPGSAAQPYGPNPAGSTQPAQLSTPATDQSQYGMEIGGSRTKRDQVANFSNSGRSQSQAYPQDAPPTTLGHRKMRQEQINEPHRRSSSPSTASLGTRKGSSSTRIGGVHHKRSKTTGQQGRREQQTADFVNYTPDDSRKLLTGVAPSGSSKTKARREKEAADRQRKLSRAAAKAVVEAGGDLDALQREGFLIEKEEDEEDDEGSS